MAEVNRISITVEIECSVRAPLNTFVWIIRRALHGMLLGVTKHSISVVDRDTREAYESGGSSPSDAEARDPRLPLQVEHKILCPDCHERMGQHPVASDPSRESAIFRCDSCKKDYAAHVEVIRAVEISE